MARLWQCKMATVVRIQFPPLCSRLGSHLPTVTESSRSACSVPVLEFVQTKINIVTGPGHSLEICRYNLRFIVSSSLREFSSMNQVVLRPFHRSGKKSTE